MGAAKGARRFKQSLRDLKAPKNNLIAWGYGIHEPLNNARRFKEASEDPYVMTRELDRHYVLSRYSNAMDH